MCRSSHSLQDDLSVVVLGIPSLVVPILGLQLTGVVVQRVPVTGSLITVKNRSIVQNISNSIGSTVETTEHL